VEAQPVLTKRRSSTALEAPAESDVGQKRMVSQRSGHDRSKTLVGGHKEDEEQKEQEEYDIAVIDEGGSMEDKHVVR